MNRDVEPHIEKLRAKGIGVPRAVASRMGCIHRKSSGSPGQGCLVSGRAVVRFRSQLMKGFSYRFVDEVPGMSGAQVALRFVLDNPNVSAAIFGTTSVEHLKNNLAAQDLTIPADVLQQIRSI